MKMESRVQGKRKMEIMKCENSLRETGEQGEKLGQCVWNKRE